MAAISWPPASKRKGSGNRSTSAPIGVARRSRRRANDDPRHTTSNAILQPSESRLGGAETIAREPVQIERDSAPPPQLVKASCLKAGRAGYHERRMNRRRTAPHRSSPRSTARSIQIRVRIGRSPDRSSATAAGGRSCRQRRFTRYPDAASFVPEAIRTPGYPLVLAASSRSPGRQMPLAPPADCSCSSA